MQNKCLNFIVCKQFKYNNQHEFCSDCFLYFNKAILLNKNIEKNQCPLCLEDSEELNIYKLDQCNHSICQSCLYNIYFDKSYINNAPINPYSHLTLKWFNFIKSRRSNKLKFRIINKYMNRITYEIDEIAYDLYIKFENIYIPKIFKDEIIELIDFQLKLQKYFEDCQIKKNKKIELIKKCPYCRKVSNEIIIYNF